MAQLKINSARLRQVHKLNAKRRLQPRMLGGAQMFEALEDRQYMSLTIDVRAADGSKTLQVTTATTVQLKVYAVVTGNGTNRNIDQLLDAQGSILATGTSSQSIVGDLTASVLSRYKASGFSNGTSQDLNADGGKDIGSNVASDSVSNYFSVRASPAATASEGTLLADGKSVQWQIATLSYAISDLKQGGETDITFRPKARSGPSATGVWSEDDGDPTQNFGEDDTSAPFVGGAPLKILDSAITPAPTATNDSFTTVSGTPLDLNVLKNDTAIGVINPASVALVTGPQHGTATINADGTVRYTANAGYLGSDTLTYTVNDNNARTSNAATVSLTVVSTPPPVANADTASTPNNIPVTVSVLANDTVTNGAQLTPSSVTIITSPTHGTAVVNSDGTITYTPTTDVVGTDTFTYTVTDSNNQVSDPATVTLTVVKTDAPTAVADEVTTIKNVSKTFNVLANDTAAAGVTLVPGSVKITSAASHGTATVNPDGTITYTPATDFVADDLLVYTVTDTAGHESPGVVVTIHVITAPAPVANNDVANVVSGAAVTFSPVANDTATDPLTITPGTVSITTQPTHGTAVVNADGTITYTSTSADNTFVGQDSLAYTVQDSAGGTSNIATVQINVGVQISSAKGGNKQVVFTDASGASVLVKLTSGTAGVTFSGTGSPSIANGIVTVTGANLHLADITMTDTTPGSVLTIKTTGGTSTIQSINDTGALGSINATGTILSGGALNVGGLAKLSLFQATNAAITIGSAGAKAVSIATGVINATNITSAVPITSLKASSYTVAGDGTVPLLKAVSVGSINVPGVFEADVAIDKTLTTAKIGSTVDAGTWQITGKTGSVSVGAMASTWEGDFTGGITKLSVAAGGLNAPINGGALGVVTVNGDLIGEITAASVKSIKVNGNVNGSSMIFNAPAAGTAALGTLTATGTITQSTINASGNIGSITANAMSGSTIYAGATSLTSVTTATAANLGSATLGSLKMKTKVGTGFANSTVLAHQITTALLGGVNVDNAGVPEGLAAVVFKKVTGTFGGVPLTLGPAQLGDEATLTTYVTGKGATFGDFKIQVVPAGA